jgi:two-component system response regulator MtrA
MMETGTLARIIIVDDDEIVTEIAGEALEAVGHMVSAVHDGDAAIAVIESSDPDLLILDYNLPGRTGMDILREVRALPHGADRPVMMITANSGRLLMARAEQTGADDYIVKPFEPSDLVRRVEALLANGSMARAMRRASVD